MINPQSRILQKCTTCRTAFFCCDIQEKLVDKIPNFQQAVKVSNTYAKMYENLPKSQFVFLATEQYPQGVGHLVKDIKLPEGTLVSPKLTPSMLTDDVLAAIAGDPSKGIEPVSQVVLWGHESHVCIIQTANALLERNIRVAVSLDGCSSQRKIDHDAAIMTMSSWPYLVMSTPTGILLQLTRGDPNIMSKTLMQISKPDQSYVGLQ